MLKSDLRAILIGIGILSLFAFDANAEELPRPELGTRLRATVTERESGDDHTRRITGRLVALSDSTITLEERSTLAGEILARQSISKLEMSVRPGRRGVGTLIGLASGAALGVAIGLAAGSDPEDSFLAYSAGEKATVMAVILAPIGAIVGALAAPGEQWEVISTDSIQLGLGAGVGRAGDVFVTVRF